MMTSINQTSALGQLISQRRIMKPPWTFFVFTMAIARPADEVCRICLGTALLRCLVRRLHHAQRALAGLLVNPAIR